jgi:Bacterial dnaA protein helix-turn-helix
MNDDELCRHYRRIRQRLYDPPPALPPPPPSPRISARDDFLTVDKIIRTTCVEFGCSRAQLLNRHRTRVTVLRRWIPIGLALRFTRRSLPQIGGHFHFDHTTVCHAGRQIKPVVDAVLDAMPDATIAELVHAMRCHIEANGWLGKQTWEDCP